MVTQQELNKVQRSLFFTMEDQDGHDRTIEIEYEECVQGTPNQLLFGSSFPPLRHRRTCPSRCLLLHTPAGLTA